MWYRKKHLDVDCVTKSGWTPLMLAADRGHTKVCELLLKLGANPYLTNRDTNQNPIALAEAGNHDKVCPSSNLFCILNFYVLFSWTLVLLLMICICVL